MVVNMDELDNPLGGPKFRPQEWKTRRDRLEQFEASLKKVVSALVVLLTRGWLDFFGSPDDFEKPPDR